ncbi:SCO family protein [Ferrimonas sediminicola]|uniref:SCO family protein n=1 Tax=Ferrimonas sediminicola TaxID=2569538 RepID=A0A4U1BCK7_9GAMM|nr:SCO family protein [Ferrimonas sediminicola]TKB48434.1 SCO family protein [Ferrimonas sediminicola]
MKHWLWVLLLVLPCTWGSDPHRVHRQAQPTAPGYFALAFPAPEPGSYRLPPLGEAADGQVLLDTGGRTNLHTLFDDKVVVLSFIYTRCPDPNGCPLASHVLARLERAILQTPGLSSRVQLLSLSFDPINDLPHNMAAYGKRYRSPLGHWQFLTTEDEAALSPILAAYNQWVMRERDSRGRATGALSHLLRVYLIDTRGRIRNIYSTGFLHRDLLLTDIHTLLLEQSQQPDNLQK